ncbi:MAG: 50S ribosomal protein L7/L12 [bacterium]
MTEEKKTDAPIEEAEVKEETKAEAPKEVKAKVKEETTEEAVEVPAKFKSLVETIEQLSVLDLAELVKVLEKKFGVSAAAPAMMMAAGPVADGAVVEEKTDFDIEITDGGAKKIAVIKVVRNHSDLGLKEAKELVDGAPKMFKESVKKEEAEKIKAELEEAGAKVTLK